MKSPTLLLVLSLVALAAGCAALTPAPPPEQNAELRLARGLAALDAGRYTEAFDDLAWVYNHCPGRSAGSHALVALAALDLDPRNRVARPDVGTELLGRVIRDPATPDWLRPMAETAFLNGLALGAAHPEGAPEPELAPDSAPMADPLEHADSLDHRPVAPADSLAADSLAADSLAADSLDHRPVEHADSLDPADPEAHVPPAITERKARADLPVPDRAPGAVEPAFGCGARVAVNDRERRAAALPTLPGPSMATLLTHSEAVRDSAIGRAETLRTELAAVREQLQATEAELERIRRTLKP